MARIRSIKPEIAQDAKLARVARDIRYHFVLLWTAADDEGCFRANPRSLLGQLYPHDHDVTEADIKRMNESLALLGLVDVFQTPDGPLGVIRNWKKHQKIDRPSKSHLAEIIATVSRNPREGAAHGVLSPESLPVVVEEELRDAEASGAVNVRDPELTALYLSICANNAVAVRWGEQMHPYTQGNAASLYDTLRAADVPPDVARLSLYRQCQETTTLVKPPRSINYFRPGILADWDEEKARRALAASGETAPAEIVRPPSGAGASGNSSSTGARREHWTDKKSREEREESERQLTRVRWGNVESRRDGDDGPAWWARMQREAKASGANPVLYAFDRIHESAEESAHV